MRFHPPAGHGSLKSALLDRMGRGTTRPPPPGHWALRDVDIDLRAGDRLGLIGANGAGKTTLLQVMCGIYQPTCGSVTRRGFVVPLLQLGLGFNPELSGRENVFLAAAVLRIPRERVATRTAAIFDFCELQHAQDLPLKYYSSGMATRLAFAVATEVDPEILLLDEIFAVGDMHWIERATERMEELLERTEILVLASHDLALVERFCNRALLIHGGRVVADGKATEVTREYRARSAGA